MERAIKVLKTAELTSLQLTTMESGLNERVQKVEEKGRERWKKSPGKEAKPKKDCRNCGYKHVLEKGKCPTLDKECRLCRKKGHFASKCNQKSSPEKKGARQKTNHISDESIDSDDVVNTLTEVVNRLSSSNTDKALVTFKFPAHL